MRLHHSQLLQAATTNTSSPTRASLNSVIFSVTAIHVQTLVLNIQVDSNNLTLTMSWQFFLHFLYKGWRQYVEFLNAEDVSVLS